MKTKFFLFALGAALALACFLSPFASKSPDGLDQFARQHGVEHRATVIWDKAPLAKYTAPMIGNPAIGTGLAGGIGTLIVFGTLFLGGRMLAGSASRPWDR